MRIPPLVLLALGTVALGELAAQERTPQQVQALLERNLPAEQDFVPGQVIVKMRIGAALTPPQLSALGLQVEERRLSGAGEFLYQMPPSKVSALVAAGQERDSTLALARALAQRPDVEYAQPNHILRILDRTPNDPRYAEQWHYFRNGSGNGASLGGINLPQVWDTLTGSRRVVVSILDTGILPDHPDISGSSNLIAGYDMISDAGRGNDGDGRDSDPTDPGDACPPQPDSWHGTHVAGTVGVGNTDNGTGVAGINWDVSVQAVRVLGVCGGTIADINDGIRWAAGLPVPGVPDNATPARVISMSLGGRGPCSISPSTQSAINDAVAAGAAIAVAAGNEASDASGFFPASCDSVITVTASDARGYLVSRYANYGETVEIMAPGGDVNRDDTGDGNPDGVLSMVRGGYAYYNGTSMAAPHVAGVLALWLAKDSTLTPAQLLAKLEDSALPRSATECPRPCGAGLLNALGTPRPPTLMVMVRLDPDKKLKNDETTTAVATVMLNGTPQPGKTVTFSSANTEVATVSPTSVVTDASGVATSTVTGVSRGTTTITATADGVSGSTPVRVPELSVIGLLVLAVLVLAAGLLRRRTAARQTRS